MFRCTDDIFSLNNSKFCDNVFRIYPTGLEINDTTDIPRAAAYIDLNLEIENECCSQERNLQQKRLFQFSSCEGSIYTKQHSNTCISANGIYIFQLICYPWACVSYSDFIDRELFLTTKLLNHGFASSKVEVITSKGFCPRTWLVTVHDLSSYMTCHRDFLT